MGTALADVRIVLDVSKSMAENDPQNARSDALLLLLNAVPNGDKAGIWTFGQYVNLLVPHEIVNDNWRANAQLKIRQLAAPAIRTNLGRALEEASYDFLFSTYRGPSHVVLITDGRVDIAPNADVNDVERERILSQVVPKYVAANARIHTIAISSQADQALLRQISQQTGGRYQRIDNPSSLSQVLADLSAEISPKNQIRLERESFTVDGTVSELTVLMFHSKGAIILVAPNGEESSAVQPRQQRWRVGNGFTQVSVSSPQSGQWRVKGDLTPNTTVQVLSDINLEWTLPVEALAIKGHSLNIEAKLVNANGQSIAADLSSIVSADLRVNGVITPMVIQGDKLVGRILPNMNTDIVNLELMVNGGTFNRLISRQIQYVEPFISEVLLTSSGYEWRLYPNKLLGQTNDINANAQFQVNGQEIVEAFTLAEAGYWVWKLPYDQSPGTYNIQLQGELMQATGKMMLSKESISLQIPPARNSGLAMTPMAAVEPMMMSEIDSDEFIKDPMPVFDELQADIVVDQTDNSQWSDEQIAASGEGSGKWMTYLLLSVPGLMVLVVGYLFYRRLEKKTKTNLPEDDLILGGDEFSQLDDMDLIKQDSDLDISSLDDLDDESMADAPVIDEIYEEEDLPTPDKTEAATIAQENTLDTDMSSGFDELGDTEEDPEEELFDISSIDDDLADLDLALDGDDPFADDEPEDKP